MIRYCASLGSTVLDLIEAKADFTIGVPGAIAYTLLQPSSMGLELQSFLAETLSLELQSSSFLLEALRLELGVFSVLLRMSGWERQLFKLEGPGFNSEGSLFEFRVPLIKVKAASFEYCCCCVALHELNPSIQTMFLLVEQCLIGKHLKPTSR